MKCACRNGYCAQPQRFGNLTQISDTPNFFKNVLSLTRPKMYSPQESTTFLDEHETLFHAPKVSEFCSLASSLNYLWSDRFDLQLFTKELCCSISNHRKHIVTRSPVLRNTFTTLRKLVIFYFWQSRGTDVDVPSDANSAESKATRKLTSGATIYICKHCIKFHSKQNHCSRHQSWIQGVRDG